MKAFWEEPIGSTAEMRLLQKQLDLYIGMVERGELKAMTEAERLEHVSRYGRGAFVVGSFVVTPR